MTEFGRNILAYFNDRAQAERAQAELRQQGYATVQLDRMTRHGGGAATEVTNPVTGDVQGLADLTASADTTGDDTGPLLAAGADASGLAHTGDHQGTGGKAWIVTVVTAEDEVNRAVQILEDSGGTV